MGKKDKVSEEICECEKNCKYKNKPNDGVYRLGWTSLIAFVFLLIGLVVGGVLTIKDIKLSNDDKKCEEKVEEETEVTDEVEEENVETETCVNNEYIDDYQKISNTIDDLGLLKSFGYDREIIDVSKLSTQELLWFAERITVKKAVFSSDFSLDDVNELIKKYFGIEVKGEDIVCPDDNIAIYLFDEKTNMFKVNEEHGGHGSSEETATALSRIVDIKVNDNEYNVKVKKAFSVDPFLAVEFYKTYDDAVNKKNKLFGINSDMIAEEYFAEVDFNNISNDQLNTYEYVFKKVDDNFVLVSYKLVK